MNELDKIELGMLASAMLLSSGYATDAEGLADLKNQAKVLFAWAKAENDTQRREIYRQWRNAGPTGMYPQQ